MSTTTSGWQLRRIAGPDVEPLTLEQARAHLKLDADLTAENDQIADWIIAAREMTEDFCKRTWVESTWLLRLDNFPSNPCDFPDDPRIVLPRGPVLDVVRVSYVDQQGATQEITDYQAALDTEPPYILPAANQWWPFAAFGSGRVEIEYRAGYASGGSPTDASGAPASVRTTMRAMIALWYENRQQVDCEDLMMAGLWRLRVLT
jgi:uncharacterized phiE125 gp8 family phage protein